MNNSYGKASCPEKTHVIAGYETVSIDKRTNFDASLRDCPPDRMVRSTSASGDLARQACLCRLFLSTCNLSP